jgi:hypothetical protein
LIALAFLLMLFILAGLLSYLPRVIAVPIDLAAVVAVNLFVILFNVNTFTSLYGFFVERRDF